MWLFNAMKSVLIFCFCFAILFGCVHTRDIQKEIADELQPSALRRAFNAQVIDLGEKSKCPDRTIHIVNAETDKVEFNMLQRRGKYMITKYYFSGLITDYLIEGYRQSRIASSSNSKKALNISVQSVDGWYSHMCGAVIRMTVTIPEKNITIPFSSKQTSLDVHWAGAYAIHDLSWQIINDPTIQDYILCR